jgi:MYXO-CTERM domain-containing protein
MACRRASGDTSRIIVSGSADRCIQEFAMPSSLKRSAIAAAMFAAMSAQAATTVYQNDFNTAAPEWSGGALESQLFGGGYWKNDAEALAGGVSVTTQADFWVAAGTSVSGAVLSLRFGAIDSWDGVNSVWGTDTLVIQVDGTTVFSGVFANADGTSNYPTGSVTLLASGTNFLGSSYNDSAYALSVPVGALAAGGHQLTFQVIGGGWQGAWDESFVLDNVAITGTVTAVPEAGTAAMLAAGIGALTLLRRRRVR